MRFPLVTENFGLKAFSLAFSLVMFFVVTGESSTPKDVDFRIEYQLDDEMMITGDPPPVLHATIQGPWANLRTFSTEELQPVVIDLTAEAPGTVRHLIDIDDINPPAGMKVVSINPTEIEVALDRRVERHVPVEPDISERPAFGFEILSVRIEPPRVRVVGPLSKMRTLDFISTRPIDVNGREDDVSIRVEVRQPPPGLRLLDRNVAVLVEIGEEFVQRNFNNISVSVDNGRRGTRVSPDAVDVTLKGPRRLVDSLKASAVKLYVDALPEAEEGQIRFEKTVTLRAAPERTVLVAPVPKVIIQMPRPRRRKR